MKFYPYFVSLIFALCISQVLWGQNANLSSHKNEIYQFKNVIEIPTTPVKDQGNSGTCWSYATTSFIETELIRLGKGEINLSEMYFVRYAYPEKAQKYLRYHGSANFSEGGQGHDVFNIISEYGFVPEEKYIGINYGLEHHDHTELVNKLKENLTNSLDNIDNNTEEAVEEVDSILDIYLGSTPSHFEYKGTDYTPKSFADKMGIIPKNYIEFTSYRSYPFYEKIDLEIPDNWSHNTYYNIPIDEMMELINYALSKGFSVNWDGDMSDSGFSHKRGVAIVPEHNPENMSKSEREQWNALTDAQREKIIFDSSEPKKEMVINQDVRQKSFDSFRTTDDHLMHLIGTAIDQNGTLYYITKNSWADDSNYMGGLLNMSESYVRLKTVAIQVHKDAIPKALKNKLNLN